MAVAVDPAFTRLVKAKRIPKHGYSGNEGRKHPDLKHSGYRYGKR